MERAGGLLLLPEGLLLPQPRREEMAETTWRLVLRQLLSAALEEV
jgi:hypothetical protein